MKRVICIVLDSVGCGHAPDAASYGDEGANTLGHLFARQPGFALPHLASLGLYQILGLPRAAKLLEGACFGKLTAAASGKDTTSGHWELMGCVLDQPFDTCEFFPQVFLKEFERRTGVEFIGNYAASGTHILTDLGEEHCRTGKPILYTSADSVLQIAAHEEYFGLERLWAICQIARNLLDESGMRIGRVIARPFIGEGAGDFQRTGNRHDYSLTPDFTVLNALQAAGVKTIGIGKIADIFANCGIEESYPTKSNSEGMATLEMLLEKPAQQKEFLFANLVDFDSLYGHRRDPQGYGRCLMEFDGWLGGFLQQLDRGDLLIITADHGNDPYHAGTDHTREQVPVLSLGAEICWKNGSFADVSRQIKQHFELTP
ncbi:MAG: phosphopentomutase [Verrucomicrobia bacterium]|nr:MAG: phosphopentomutase [Verrucomicrobiota bacterium]